MRILNRFFAFWDALHQKTWYVNWGKKLDNARFTTQYIGRYAKRPAMSEFRIRDYDGTNVTFEYEDKTAKEHTIMTLPAEQFITKIIRHIQDKNFRGVRQAGICSTRTRKKDLPVARTLLKPEQGKRVESKNWRQRRREQNGYDPLVCHHCGSELVLVKIVYKSRDGPLKEITFNN